MTDDNQKRHRGSKLIEDDPVAVETIEQHKRIEREDAAFVARLRAAILSGKETARGVLGHNRGE